MVVSQQKHPRYKAAFYLTVLLIITGCTSSTPYTIIDLHFKTADQVKPVLEFILSDTDDFKFSNQTIIIPPDTKNLEAIQKIIKDIDKPPSAYTINLSPNKHSRQHSTNNQTDIIYLTEGVTSSILVNHYNISINVQRATSESSLIKLVAIKSNQKQPTQLLKENWVIPHGKVTHPQKILFPKGLQLDLSTTH